SRRTVNPQVVGSSPTRGANKHTNLCRGRSWVVRGRSDRPSATVLPNRGGFAAQRPTVDREECRAGSLRLSFDATPQQTASSLLVLEHPFGIWEGAAAGILRTRPLRADVTNAGLEPRHGIRRATWAPLVLLPDVTDLRTCIACSRIHRRAALPAPAGAENAG